MQIFCKTPREAKQVFKTMMTNSGNFQILRFKPRFTSYLCDMIINFNWLAKYICELQIKLGDGNLSRGYSEQHFVYTMLRCINSRSVFLMMDNMAVRLRQLMLADKLDYDKEVPTGPVYFNAYPQSLQAILEAEGTQWKDIQI